MTRREMREHVFRELFTADFYAKDGHDLPEQLDLYFTHLEGDGLDYPPDSVDDADKADILQKTEAVIGKLEEIDSLIGDTSVGWAISRMNRTDLAILRLGVYELLFDESVPPGVAINEAVLLARKFGGEDSYSFVNGILGKIHKSRSAESAEAPGQIAR